MKEGTDNSQNTQINAVLKYLKKHRSITSMEAFEQCGATRLPALIHDLRKRGYEINTVMIESHTRYGTPCAYAKYKYVKYNGLDNTLNIKKLRGER